ncbi:adaptive-response sensory-kinase [Haloferax mucosum ATCC BAA-1512]|uniref:histidine kinase n=1 Tax=Haloferax mucosum ATCC BAA-1512 TaxID=662479 RepID=M0IU15_9EURY|nr:ATP-binding protein [Haloferax mucosum]ELZ98969.1 adaptive-response sensory-kinase [Haloferax mucosum ATCC BAA-1512]
MSIDPQLRVLSVGGDRAISRAVEQAVSRMTVEHVETLDAARSALEDGSFDCLILAETLPDGDGTTVLREARAAELEFPVVFLADDPTSQSLTELVDLGISGYLTGDSFDPDEALAPRVGRLARRHRVEQSTRVSVTESGQDGDRGWVVEDALDALDDVFYVYDQEGRLVSWNSRFSELTNKSDEELFGTHAESFFADGDSEVVRRAVEQVMENGETVFEARLPTTRGTILFQLTGHRLVAPDGTVVGFCGVGRDITVLRQHEERLARQNERLDEFARVLSHDLRNPLSISTGFLNLERQENDSEYLERVATSLDRMSEIVSNVLKAARRERTVVEFSPIAFESLVEQAWDTADTGNATLDIDTEKVIHADSARLQRLFENLFRNVADHAGPTPTVTVEVLDGDTGFVVEDDGNGIDSDIAGQVFEPGFTTAPNGTGFGLDIVRSLAEAHGWSVSVVDCSSSGARFEFTGVSFTDSEPELDGSGVDGVGDLNGVENGESLRDTARTDGLTEGENADGDSDEPEPYKL